MLYVRSPEIQTFLIEHTMHHRRLLLVVGTWACTRCSARTRLSRMISTSSTRSGATFPTRSWPTRRKMQRRRCENESFCLSTFCLKVIVLPRQARDTQKESTHKRRLPFMHRRCGRKCRGRPVRWYVRVAAAAAVGARRRRRARKARRRRPRRASEAAARTAEGVVYWSSSLSHTLSRKHTLSPPTHAGMALTTTAPEADPLAPLCCLAPPVVRSRAGPHPFPLPTLH